jgi:hypothetical protein
MSNERQPLAARRAALVAECEQQRQQVRQEFAALKAPVSADGIRSYLRTYLSPHRKLLLGVAGVALGLVATRPKRLLSLAGAGMSIWKLARGLLPLLRSRAERAP